MKTLYLSDLDGTFLRSDGSISDFAKRELNRMTRAGLWFTVATARTYATVVPMFRGISLPCPLVLMNGVCIYDGSRQTTLRHHALPKDVGRQCEAIFARYGKNPMLYFEADSRIRVEYKFLVNDPQRAYVAQRDNFFNKGFTRGERYSFDSGDDLIYVVTLDRREEIEDLCRDVRTLPGTDWNFYADTYTGCYFLEGMPKGVSKASGALEVKQMLGADRIVAFGDNVNDIPLFAAADEAYAVSNACDELKAAATGVIGSNDDDAVVRFLTERFEKENPNA